MDVVILVFYQRSYSTSVHMLMVNLFANGTELLYNPDLINKTICEKEGRVVKYFCALS